MSRSVDNHATPPSSSPSNTSNSTSSSTKSEAGTETHFTKNKHRPSSSTSNIKQKIDRRSYGDTETYKANVKGLREFWNSQIQLNSTVRQRSQTLSYQTKVVSEEGRSLEQSGRFNSLPALNGMDKAETNSIKPSVNLEPRQKVDNFCKYKTAETVKVSRSKEDQSAGPRTKLRRNESISKMKRNGEKFNPNVKTSKTNDMVSDNVVVEEKPNRVNRNPSYKKISVRTLALTFDNIAISNQKGNKLVYKSNKKTDDDASSTSSRVSNNKKKSSVRRKASTRSRSNLKNMFDSPKNAKPKVPDKSETVLQRCSELRLKKSDEKLAPDLSEQLRPTEHSIKEDAVNIEELSFDDFSAGNTMVRSSTEINLSDHLNEKSEDFCETTTTTEDDTLTVASFTPNVSTVINESYVEDPLTPQIDFTSDIFGIFNLELVEGKPEEKESERGLLDALHTVGARIESLSKQKCDDIRPNQSFLFSSIPKPRAFEIQDSSGSIDDIPVCNKLLNTIGRLSYSNASLYAENEYNTNSDDDVYQTLPDDDTETPQRNVTTDFETVYGYEVIENIPEPPPPRNLPSLPIPEPKRNLGHAPPRPAKPYVQHSLPNLSDKYSDNSDEEDLYDVIGQNRFAPSGRTHPNSSESPTYDSIIKTEYRFAYIRHGESTQTLSSDQKTNSIYGMVTNSTLAPSERSGNDSDWVDATSDDESEKSLAMDGSLILNQVPTKRRRRSKYKADNQSPSDDDPHYESVCPLEQARRKLGEKFDPKQLLPSKNDDHADDSFDDSFESDCESDTEKKADADITNAKLPDPPQKQVYALMQKIKTLGSISKQEISKSFNRIRKKSASSPKTEKVPLPGQPYENTTFYVNTAMKQEERKVKKPQRRNTTTAIELPYENHEFHSPIISSPILNSQAVSSPTQGHDELSSPGGSAPELLSRKKSKSGRSFKSKLRKSFATESSLSIGSSVYGNNSRSTFYISDSVDVDSGIFAGDNTKLGASQELEKPNNVDRKSPTPDLRRRSVSVRPNNPPPPPPPDRQPKKSMTSWYAECGVFKSEAINGNKLKVDKGNTTSWYTEAGLYQTSGDSVSSSTGSSGVSTGCEGGPGDDSLHSMFLNEPLYQIYNANRLEMISRDSATDSDGYEEVGRQTPSEEKKPQRPTALQLVEPNKGSNRTLWSEVSEVISSGILGSLTATERYIQEAKFEILTSEASYLKSLNLLKSHFMNHPAFRDNQILSTADRKTLFQYIIPVQECSDRLLSDLESCWQDNIMLIGLSKSLMKNAEKTFKCYIKYCEHQGILDRTLKRLKEAKGPFAQILEILETDPVCCGLTIHSFLMLPMQRITRFPLLIDTVLNKLKDDDDEKESWTKVMHLIRKIASECNDAANRCEQKFIMQTISQQIEFPSHIRPLPIVPAGIPAPGTPMRTLVKKGEMTHLIWRGEEAKLTFGKKFTKTPIYAFLFTDLLILTKKKGDDMYLVFDHCARSMVTVSSGDVIPQLPIKEVSSGGKHLILMTLLENYDGKTVELILSCPSETERERWLQATEPPSSENPDEKLYEQWDCPQVIAKHRYEALQPDELSLEVGDIINVFRKMVDGWYHGERVCDSAQGWFPGNFTEETNSQHVRARTLKERYKLTQSGNYTPTILARRK